MKKTVALVVIDGFGVSNKEIGDATKVAKMPYYKSLVENYPHCLLRASGEFVGLKKGQMGNSETGHLNIGAGRVVKQDLTIIDDAINNQSFYKNEQLCKLMEITKQGDNDLHIMGLISNGGIHSHINHLFATLKLAKEYEIKNVFIHCFTDGRDTSPTSSVNFVKQIMHECKKLGVGEISTVVGRFYAMDREKLYERTLKAYNLMVNGEGKLSNDLVKSIKASYENNITDEFLKPIKYKSKTFGTIKPNDSVIFFNFRKDRAKQITDSLINKNFIGFKTDFVIKNFLTFSNLGDGLETMVAFDKKPEKMTLSEVVSLNNMTQAKFAEPTKFPHVTYFLNGGNEKPFKNEDWFKIPPKKVETFDLAPQMSAIELAETLRNEVKKDRYDFVMCNLANCDMVGHTGNFEATVKACEFVDKSLSIIVDHIKSIGGEVVIVADHGNCEQMIYRNKICTTHSNNPVRLILASDKRKNCKLKKGALKDIAPTILELLNINKPNCYTGNSLIVNL